MMVHTYKVPYILFFLFTAIGHVNVFGQSSVGINTTSPNENAVLELVSPSGSQGLLVPRLTTSQKVSTSFTSLENGMLVFDTDEGKFYYWHDGQWLEIINQELNIPVDGDLTGNLPNPELKLTGITPGTYTKLTLDAKGRALAGSGLSAADIPVLTSSKIIDITDIGSGKIMTDAERAKLNSAITTSTTATGDLTGTFPELELTDTGISPNSYTKVTVNAKGRVVAGGSLIASDIPLLTTAKLLDLNYSGGSNGAILISNGGTLNTVSITGDASLNGLGELSLSNNAVENAMLHHNIIKSNAGLAFDSDNSLFVDINGLSENISPTGEDFLPVYSASGATLTKVKLDTLFNLGQFDKFNANRIAIGYATWPANFNHNGNSAKLDATGVNIATPPVNPSNLILAVNGDGYINDNFYVGNTIYCGNLSMSSDFRLKKDIHPIQNALNKLLLLNGVHYHWKDGIQSSLQDPTMQTGLIAQEVEKVFPEFVQTHSNGFKTVNYIGLIPVIIESLKAQNDQMEKVTNETIRQLQEENTQLKNELEKIKAYIGMTGSQAKK
ncbi:tail fiber domain-containing protein [Rapidithrix thailandica]|uniref:Tail fiber domain-containing protein n=1 Tax=Rapidithrix thailandica TaxID=413964 RepID=A0AAW9SJD5_9BACT